MNIHINKSQHEYLQKLVEKSYRIGSHLYGTSNENSDVDVLCVYDPDEFISLTITEFNCTHQFQYKDVENNIDYIYTTSPQFRLNQMSGESTINSDVLLFIGNPKLEACFTYKVIKGYLGMAKRDLKQYKEGRHKLIHAKRGLYCAEMLMNKRVPSLEVIRTFYNMEHDVQELIECEKQLRNKLTDMFNKDEIKMYYIPQILQGGYEIFQILLDSKNIKEFKY